MLKNLVTLAVSGLVSLLIGEAAVRLVLDPVDYLYTDPVHDPILAHKIDPGRAGHDDWGYRNPDVPDQAQIMAIGDSMTYGLMAKMREAWPARLQELSDKTVYNAGMGGYGPLQYMHVLKTRAPALSPEQVVVMVYIGNDLMDTYNLAYSADYWQDYRLGDGPEQAIAPNVFTDDASDRGMVKKLRDWLAQNSVLYRLVLQSPLFDGFRRTEWQASSGTGFEIEHLGTPTFLDPVKRLEFVNYDDPRVREAFEIIKRALRELAAEAKAMDIPLHVALMPVREHVFRNFIPDTIEADQRAVLAQLDQSVQAIEAEFAAFFAAEGISWTDLRPPLEAALANENIFPPADGHPNALGYDVIANTLLPVTGTR